MNWLNNIFDIITAPFASLSPVLCLVLLSLASAVVLLTAFKKLSNQEKIKLHKNKIFGYFLEIAIYRDQFRRTINGQINVLRHNLLYMRYFLTPILVMMIPMSLICLQLDYRLGSKPLEIGDSFIIQARLDPGVVNIKQALDLITITPSDNIELESRAVKIPAESSIYWRATVIGSAKTMAKQDSGVKIAIGNQEEQKKTIIISGAKAGRFSTDRRKINSLTDIIYSAGKPIPDQSKFIKIRTDYQAATYPFLFWQISPIVYFFILTLGFGLILKPIMKVNI